MNDRRDFILMLLHPEEERSKLPRLEQCCRSNLLSP
jgi:hypothetical protein